GGFHPSRVNVAQAGRPRDRERAGPLGVELGIEHEERHAAEMIGVEMGHQDRVDGVAVDAPAVDADKRGSPAIDEERGARRAHMETRVEARAAAEGVPTPDESNVHGRAIPPDRRWPALAPGGFSVWQTPGVSASPAATIHRLHETVKPPLDQR